MRNNYAKYVYMIYKYGKFSKPYINIILSEKMPDEWKYYFMGKVCSWNKEFESSLNYFDLSEKNIIKNNDLDFLLLIEKLSLTKNIKNELKEKIYGLLKNKTYKMSPFTRKVAAISLINFEGLEHETYEYQKIFGRTIIEEPIIESYIERGLARNHVKEGDKTRALMEFKKSYLLAQKAQHPGAIINSLNDIMWYSMEEKKLSKYSYRKAVYSIGKYYEDFGDFLSTLDTISEACRNKNDIFLYYLAFNVETLKEDIVNKYPENKRKKYGDCLRILKDITKLTEPKQFEITNDFIYTVENYYETINELEKKSRISRVTWTKILNKREKIKAETIRKAVRNLRIIPNLKHPEEIIISYLINKTEDRFENAMFTASQRTKEENMIEFMACCTALYNRPTKLKKLNLQKTYTDFTYRRIKNLKENEESIYFISLTSQTNHDYFYRARYELTKAFFEEMKKEKVDIFRKKYFKLPERKKKILDTFIRNYSRYREFNEIKIKERTRIKNFCEEYGLDIHTGMISYYSFDTEKYRNTLTEIMGILMEKL